MREIWVGQQHSTADATSAEQGAATMQNKPDEGLFPIASQFPAWDLKPPAALLRRGGKKY